MSQIALSDCIELQSAPGFFLERDAARALDRAVAKFGKRLILTGAWRAYAVQERLFRARYVIGDHRGKAGFTSDVRKWNGVPWTRRKGTAAAAVPGTSNHGSGRAIDVKTRRDPSDPPYSEAVIFASWNDADRREFLRVAKDEGWAEDEGLSVNELWHITYYPTRDKNRGKTVQLEENMDLTKKNLEDIADAVFNRNARDGRHLGLLAKEAADAAKAANTAARDASSKNDKIIELVREIQDTLKAMNAPVELTELSNDIIELATGERRTDKVRPRDAASYMQALAFAKREELEEKEK